MSYFSLFPEYARRWLLRADTAGGILVGLIWFVIAMLIDISGETALRVGLGILALVVVESGYGVFREERTMRAEREKNIRVTATLGSYSVNFSDPGPDKASIKATIAWEVWANEDVTFEKLVLNVIYVYDKHWWQFWKKTRFPKVGIPPTNRQEGTQYRKRVRASDPQPFVDHAQFEYVGNQEDEDPHCLLELVLIAGMPVGEYRIPVFIDWNEIHSRGTNSPL